MHDRPAAWLHVPRAERVPQVATKAYESLLPAASYVICVSVTDPRGHFVK